MTTKLGGGGPSRLVPALGETWSHAVTNRVMLFWKGGNRFASLTKSPSRVAQTVPYQGEAVGFTVHKTQHISIHSYTRWHPRNGMDNSDKVIYLDRGENIRNIHTADYT